MKYALGGTLAAVYIAVIVAANYATTEHGMVSVGFGLTATAGTYLIGLLLILRDSLQDVAGKYAVFGAIAIGAIASYLVADPFIATASACAFVLAETIDFAIYTPLRNRGYLRAAVASNIVGAVVDTLAFLWIAGFPLTTEGVSGQLLGKLALTGVVVALIAAWRSTRRVNALPR